MIMNNLDDYLSKSLVQQVLKLYLLLIIAITTASGLGLFQLSNHRISNPQNGLGLLVLSVALVFVYLEIMRGKIDLSKLAKTFFESQLLRYGFLTCWIVQVLLQVFGSPIVTLTAQAYLFQWGFFVSAVSLATYITFKFYFIRTYNEKSADLESISNRQIIVTIILASLLGCLIGYLMPNAHVAVEQGQVLAKLVDYAPTNPWYVYQAKLWNFWGQLSALGLSLGISEIGMSIVLSCLAGAIFSTSVALIGLSITKNTAFSLMMPFILLQILLLDDKLSLKAGFGYPLMFVGDRHTYGMIGMSYAVLVLALFILKKDRIGFLFLGFSVMMHPSLGIWTHVTIALYVLSDYRNIVDWIKKGTLVSIGYAVSIFSFIWQRSSFTVPYLSADIEEKYLKTIVENYSIHSDYVLYLNTPMGYFLLLIFLTCITWFYIGNYSYRARHSFKLVILVTFIGVLGHIFSVFPNYISNLVHVLLPNRFLNIAIYLFAPILLAILFLFLFQIVVTSVTDCRLSAKHKARLVLGLRTTIIFLSSCYLLFTFNNALINFEKLNKAAFGRFSDPVYVEAQKREDLLLVSASNVGFNTSSLQLFSGRPIVLNPLALDNLLYTVEAAPQTDEIFREIYGIDFFRKNILARIGQGKTDANDIWTERSIDEWVALADKFGFSQVLTHPGLELKLPIAAQNEDGVTLYQIP